MDEISNVQGLSEKLLLICLLALFNAGRCEEKQFSLQIQDRLRVLSLASVSETHKHFPASLLGKKKVKASLNYSMMK